MTLRAQIAVALLATAIGSSAILAVSYLRLNERSLDQSQERQIAQTLEEVRRVRDEAEFAKDPLMLVDALKSLLRTRPDLLAFTIRQRGLETRVGPPLGSLGESDARTVSAGAAGSAEIDVSFSRAIFDRQRREARATALTDMRASVGIVLPVGLALALLLAGRLSRRLHLLSATVEQIGQGRLGATAEVHGSDEVGRLAVQINQMSRRLQELESAKKQFIASVTHELRSPLASIESCVRLIRSEKEGRTQLEDDMLRRIEANASRLGHFVTNLLEMAKIERGKLELHPKPTDVRKLMEDAVLFFEPRAREGGIDLRLLANGDLPPNARVDPDLLTQLLANLVSNAIKFTPKGGAIEVEAHRRDGPDGRAWIECQVRDSGIGIPAPALAKIFAPFERVPNSTRAGGTGLGLAISKAIVDLHGGQIGVDSAPGKGSVFTFRVPA